MALAPDNLRFTLKYDPAGGPDGSSKIYFASLQWDEHETGDCFYRVETQTAGVWSLVGDIINGARVVDIQVASGNPIIANISNVRVTCIAVPDDGSPGVATLAFTVPAKTNVAPSAFAAVPHGHVGDATGSVDLTWFDASVWVTGAKFQLRKVSGNVLLFSGELTASQNPSDNLRSLTSYSGGIGTNFGGSFGAVGLGVISLTLPVYLKQPLSPGVVNTPEDLKDGDLLSFVLTTAAGAHSFTFKYYREAEAYGFTRVATQGQPFSFQVPLQTDTNSITSGVTFSILSGADADGPLPPGLSISSTGLITGTPTTPGNYMFDVVTTNASGVSDTTGIGIIQVNVSAVPVFTGPATTQTLQTQGAVSLRLTATNAPSSFAITSGTLPAGLSLNTTTGFITGTPTTPQSSAPVVFTATNAAGTSSTYSIAFIVTALTPPAVTSAATLTAFAGEAVNYALTADKPASDFSVAGLPAGLKKLGTAIVGVVSPSVALRNYTVTVRAINAAGSGPEFNLVLTVTARAPVITSKLTGIVALIGKPFSYQISANHSPTSYSVGGLPAGLTFDASRGVISGLATTPGDYAVAISATNIVGTATASLALSVQYPAPPVIDTSATAGRSITAKSNIDFVFQPVASNSPTSWAAQPIPLGLTFDSTTGQLSGAFAAAGLYSIIFVASNTGGVSDPVTFFFLVEQGPPAAIAASGSSGAGVDLWIEVQNGIVSTSSPSIDQPVADTPAKIQAKRGDTLPLTLRFHKSGRPVDLAPTSLKTAGRIDFDEDYLISTTNFYPVKDSKGVFVVYPQLSDNSDLDDALEDEDSIDLLSEVQWETNEVLPGLGGTVTTRRSSKTFTIEILRDVINPD